MTVAAAASSPVSRQGGWMHAYVWTLFYLMPFADAATGYLVLSGNFAEAAAGSISQLLRAALLIPALLIIRGRATYMAALPILYVLGLEAMLLTLNQQMGWFIISTVYGFKLVYLVISYLALRELSLQQRPVDVGAYFIHGASLYGLILVLSTAAGLSTPTYSQGNFGSKGLFASGNGLALYLGCAALLALVRAGSNRGSKALAEAVFLLACCLLVGTKASMVCALVFMGMVLQRASLASRLIALGLVVLAVLFLADQIGSAFALIFDVILYRYDNSESLFSFIASGRDIYISEALDGFDPSGWGIVRLIFGAGAFVSFRDPGAALNEYDTLESDFFDIFFGYGALGLICYLLIILWGVRLGIRHRRYALLTVWVCTCFYSAAAGHVAFNAMSGMAIPVFLIALQQPRKTPLETHA